MVSIAGSKKLKRQMAPQFWGITRKDKRFVITTKPGPHKKNFAIPTAVFLRDTLKIVTSLREAKASIYSGKVKIDGVKKEKTKGDKFDVYIHTSNLVITSLNSSDKWRMAKLQGKDPKKQPKESDTEKNSKETKVEKEVEKKENEK